MVVRVDMPPLVFASLVMPHDMQHSVRILPANNGMFLGCSR